MKLLVMKFSLASSYFLPPRPRCFYQRAISIPHNTIASKTAGVFSVTPVLKIRYSKYLTSRIIMITLLLFSRSPRSTIQDFFVLSFQGVSLPPSVILNITQYKTHTWLFCTVMLLEVLFITVASCLQLTERTLRSVNLTTSNYVKCQFPWLPLQQYCCNCYQSCDWKTASPDIDILPTLLHLQYKWPLAASLPRDKSSKNIPLALFYAPYTQKNTSSTNYL